MNKMIVTDFNKSSIGWFGQSKGKFKLASILTYYDKLNNQVTYGLSQSVLAGNVYRKNNLIKNPSYMFQVFGNRNKQKILRTDLQNKKFDLFKIFNKRKNIFDTELSKIFDDFQLEISKREAVRLTSFNDIYKFFNENNLISKIKFHKFQNLNFEIEFPINHLNVTSNMKRWQIETGPILFPLFKKKERKFKILPSFVIFNKFNSIDIFYDYPFGLRNKKHSYLKNIECEIEIYSLQNNNSISNNILL